MKDDTVVTSKGTTTIPEALRKELGISPGTVICWFVEGGKLVGVKQTDELNAMQQRILRHSGSWKGSLVSGKELLKRTRS